MARGSDCQHCGGKNDGDCVMCGGSGWNPPARDPDRRCGCCGRALWYGSRGPVWYAHLLDEHDDDPRCEPCLRRSKTPPVSQPRTRRRSMEDITL